MRYKNIVAGEIERKLGDIDSCADYHMARRRTLMNEIRQTRDVYSFMLEHPNYRGGPEFERSKKIIRKGIKRLEGAWEYLCRNVSQIGSLDKKDVVELGAIIDNDNTGLRTQRVTMGLPKYTPPNPLKVEELLEKSLEESQAEDFTELERAAHFHLCIAAIQPFSDGNKRTGRLLQDYTLHLRGLPPAIIPLSERSYYIDILQDGMIAWREENLKGQGPFFNYIAAKINVSFDKLLSKLLDNSKCVDCLAGTEIAKELIGGTTREKKGKIKKKKKTSRRKKW